MEFTAQSVRGARLVSEPAQEGEIPAAVEYRTKHGSGYLPLRVTPDESLVRDGVRALKLLQSEDGSWKAVVYKADGAREELDASAQIVDGLLAEGGIANPIYAPEFIASPEQAKQAQESAGQDDPPW